jgi:beta-lactam-binding protein with PASTA domain
MKKIFVSYAREDEARVRTLVAALERQGWSVFWDRRIPAGKTWRTSIGKALAEAHCVIVAWSVHSIDSEFVAEEADDAKQRGVLVPVLLDAVLPPLGFRSIHAADLSGADSGGDSPQLGQLFADVGALFASRSEGPAPVPPRPDATRTFRLPARALAAAIGAAALVAGAVFVAPQMRGLEVPGVTGKPVEEARQAIAAAGLVVDLEKTTEVDNAPPGSVIQQEPPQGMRLIAGRGVKLTVAVPVRIEVPNVVGTSLDRAKSLLAERGLVLGQAQTKESSDAVSGTVITQSPKAGTRLARSDGVAVVIAVGSPVLLADLRGRPLEQARKALAAAGLRVGKIEYRKDTESQPGSVLDQSPRAGERVEADGKVDLVLAAKPESQVPELVSLPLSQARAALAASGLGVGEVTASGLHGRGDTTESVIRTQSPPAHARVKLGSKVDLVVADLGIRVPDVTRIPLSSAKQLLEKAGLALGARRDKADPTSSVGVVLEQATEAGTVVPKGASINLTVAAKPPVATLVVPNVVGMARTAATERLHSMGFVSVATRAVNRKQTSIKGEVVSQTPAAGAAVAANASITLDFIVVLDWYVAPAKISSSGEAQQRAAELCPTVCTGAGMRWGGTFGYTGALTCGCEP